ncbi:MAG: ABC transporter ATP-binding protein [Anaerolineae bacterium]|nr:ABC transporter ATP-binding protein [Phycisphaerae bacterium]
MLLKVSNLAVSYGAIEALHGVSLQIDSGEIVCLIGSNGAGKTTLLRTISGLLRPTRGQLLFNGETEIHEMAAHEIVRLGISHSPEGRQVFANMTVRENLLLGGYLRKHSHRTRAAIRAAGPATHPAEPAQSADVEYASPSTPMFQAHDPDPDVEDVFYRFPVLGERRHQKAGTLSGGEQQMLAIGRALMQRPKLLLLDEPSLGLAPLIVRKIFQIIKEINAEGTTVFLVEQNAKQALAIAHRGYVMQTGQVIKTDLAANLLEDPEVKKAYLGG